MGKSRVHWFCFPFLKVSSSFRKCSLFRRSLFITFTCVVYLCFVISQVGLPQRNPGSRAAEDQRRHTRGLHNVEMNGAAAADAQNRASSVVPTRSNVVYIRLKSKRRKPTHIRGTIRPKLRKKVRRKVLNPPLTQNKLRAEQHAGQPHLAFEKPWKQTPPGGFKSLNIIHDDGADSQVSSIRLFSQMAPSWFSAQDLETMRFLADARVLRMKEVSFGGSSSVLMFEGEAMAPLTNQNHSKQNRVCGGQCGLIHSPVDNTEVFAFHLDRVLGLNRTVPAVSRKFSFLHGVQSCPVVSWDASLYPEALAAGPFTVSLTWREYQNSLTQRCWHRHVRPKPDSGCSTIHHCEWSKVALFDFLLQIHNRLDQSCCGFRPRQEDVCTEVGQQASCEDPDSLKLANIVHRRHDLGHLVFTNNKGYFDRNEDNLDFRLLEGIKEFPEQAVSVLQSRKLRQKLLQSLFLDQFYWESQGGRSGIDKLIDVIEKRAEVLLTYIIAHGVKVIAMND
ncbi:Golgi-associated kinase 1B [Nematolebias whitei]|uniref:Golgi-associated kinase 1B n=1 Tax=Nematolebias whitei TaxID=451745 RepID=UPI00189C4AA9|nr:Golgi-associated kinase 1B [Nematolebias whitei]